MMIERLAEGHDLSNFRCGDKGLDRYLRKHALFNDSEGYGVTFVVSEEARTLGYYTLSNGRVDHSAVPLEETEGLPRYPVPSVLLSKLAIHREIQGRGLGRILLVNAYERFLAIGELSGARLFEVDALDQKAKAFYLRRNFKELLDDPLHLFLTRRDVLRILGRGEA